MPTKKSLKDAERVKRNKEKKPELTPRQIRFLELYLNPESETFGNATQSALRAGFKQEYAENITHRLPNWLAENVGDSELIALALKNLKELLDEDKDKRIKADMTKFTLERLHKKKFSTKTEVEHKGKLELDLEITDKQKKQLLNELNKELNS